MKRSSLVGIVVFVVSLLRSLADGFGLTDESWFLQVVHRVREGAVLYRDVSYGATPLAVNVTTWLSYAMGLEILIVKIVTNAAFALTIVIVDRVIRRIGVSSAMSWLAIGATILWARPYANPPYTPLAMLFFVATMAWSLDGLDPEAFASPTTRWAFVLAGICAGLSFTAKQNIGLLALGAAVAAVAVTTADRKRAFSQCTLMSAGFVAATALVLAPVVTSGGFPALWNYGFAGKGAYVRFGDVSYATSLSIWMREMRAFPALSAATGLAHGLVLVLPFIVALVLAWRWRTLDASGRILILFAAAAVATAFPRWDRFHMGYAVPIHLLALAALLRPRESPSVAVARRVGVAAWGWGLAATALLTCAAALPLLAFAGVDGRRPSSLPHFRGPLLAPSVERDLAAHARALATETGGQPTFILGTDAGFWYLEAGLSNPTPFDIPAVTSVGRIGVTSLVAAVSEGRISRVCISNGPPSRADLVDVAAAVRERLRQGADVGPCTLYRRLEAFARLPPESP